MRIICSSPPPLRASPPVPLMACFFKRLGLLREIVPATTLIAVLLNPAWATFDTQLNDVQEAARTVGQQVHVLRANTEREIDAAFDTAKEVHASAMMVGPSTFFTVRREFNLKVARSLGLDGLKAAPLS